MFDNAIDVCFSTAIYLLICEGGNCDITFIKLNSVLNLIHCQVTGPHNISLSSTIQFDRNDFTIYFYVFKPVIII